MRAELVDDAALLEQFRADWDALAVELARPFCSPAWMLAWWRHAAPEGALLRTVVVLDQERLVGIAPFFAERSRGFTRYRLLGCEASLGLEPLAAPDADAEVGAHVAEALAGARPRPDVIAFEGIRSDSAWPSRLRDAWPRGRPTLRHELSMDAPGLDIAGRTYDEWLASKTSSFRSQMNRLGRRLAEQGGSFRQANGEEELDRGLRAFADLHHARWSGRGGSAVLTPGVERMLPEVARDLAARGRFRLWVGEAEDRVVVADVWIAAGGEASMWLGGFDDEWGRLKVTLQALLAATEDCFARGDRRIDLGGGRNELKSRLAEDEHALEWLILLPPGPRRPLVRMALLPRRLRRAASDRLSPEAKARLKRLLRA